MLIQQDGVKGQGFTIFRQGEGQPEDKRHSHSENDNNLATLEVDTHLSQRHQRYI